MFVGNIPYDMSEEQLIDIFREVGTVVGFRLVFDRETGKPKGYGFCEFEDTETAASAVRNLNDKDVGGRPLRIDWADVDPMFEGKSTSMGYVEGEDLAPGRGARRPGPQQGGPGGMMGGGGGGGGPGMGMGMRGPMNNMNMNMNMNNANNKPLPPNLPQGQPLPPGVGGTDAISQTLAVLPPNQLLDILAQMKSLVSMAPDQAKTLLNGHPQLAYALFQAMLMMNVVDANILQRILSNSGALSGGGAAGGMQPPHMMQQQQPPHAPQGPMHPQPPHMQMGPGGPMGGGPGGFAPPMHHSMPPPPQQMQQGFGGPPMSGAPALPDDQRVRRYELLLEETFNLLIPTPFHFIRPSSSKFYSSHRTRSTHCHPINELASCSSRHLWAIEENIPSLSLIVLLHLHNIPKHVKGRLSRV